MGYTCKVALHLFAFTSLTVASELVNLDDRPECGCTCDEIIEGNLNDPNEAISILFVLNGTGPTSVSIDTCDSDFDTYIELFNKDHDFVYQSIAHYDENRCGPSFGSLRYMFNEQLSTNLVQGEYRIDIGSASLEEGGAYRVRITYDACDHDGNNDDAGTSIPTVLIVFLSVFLCWLLGLLKAIKNWRAEMVAQNDPDGGTDPDEDTPLVGRWIAVNWSGGAKPGGDPDPQNDEKIVVVKLLLRYNRNSQNRLTVQFENRGMDKDLYTMTDANHATYKDDGETFEMSYDPDSKKLIFEFGYRQHGTIVYERNS